jgi:hypothetical protein
MEINSALCHICRYFYQAGLYAISDKELFTQTRQIAERFERRLHR